MADPSPAIVATMHVTGNSEMVVEN